MSKRSRKKKSYRRPRALSRRLPVVRRIRHRIDTARRIHVARKQIRRHKQLNLRRRAVGLKPLPTPEHLKSYTLTFGNVVRYSRCKVNQQIRRRMFFRHIGRGGSRSNKRSKTRNC